MNGFSGTPPQGPFGNAPPGATPPPGGYGAPSYGQAPAPFGYQQAAPRSYTTSAVTTGAPAVKWVILGTYLGGIAFSVVGSLLGNDSESSDAGALGLIAVPFFVAYVISVLVWIYKSWEMLPPVLRVLGNGTPVSPGAAVGKLFIPLYNLYWYFASSIGLCDALNHALESLGSPKRASKGLAIAASVFQVIPYLNVVIAPFLWIPYMFSIESAKREYARRSGLT